MTNEQTTRPNFELLRELAGVIRGIPGRYFDLGQIATSADHIGVKVEGCKSICCAIGWAGLYPPFQELGLKTILSNYGYFAGMSFAGVSIQDQSDYYKMGEKFFNLRKVDSLCLFGSHHGYGDHRKVFAKRLIELFDAYNEPVSDEYRQYAFS